MATDNDPSKNRKFIRLKLESICLSGGTLDEVIDELVEIRKRFADNGCESIRLHIDDDCDCDCDCEIQIIGERWETDAEVVERLANEERAQREEYERLKARFEKAAE